MISTTSILLPIRGIEYSKKILPSSSLSTSFRILISSVHAPFCVTSSGKSLLRVIAPKISFVEEVNKVGNRIGVEIRVHQLAEQSFFIKVNYVV